MNKYDTLLYFNRLIFFKKVILFKPQWHSHATKAPKSISSSLGHSLLFGQKVGTFANCEKIGKKRTLSDITPASAGVTINFTRIAKNYKQRRLHSTCPEENFEEKHFFCKNYITF